MGPIVGIGFGQASSPAFVVTLGFGGFGGPVRPPPTIADSISVHYTQADSVSIEFTRGDAISVHYTQADSASVVTR